MGSSSRFLACAGLALIVAEPAAAHASIEGAEGFLRGLLNPLCEPLQGLLTATSGILITRASAHQTRPCLGVLAGSACLGLGFGLLVWPSADVSAIVLHASILAAALTAVIWRLPPRWLLLLLCGLCGLVAGANAVSAPGPGRWATSSGSLIGGMMFAVYAFGAFDWLKHQEARWGWMHLAPRLAASWIAAIAILALAFSLAGPAV